MACTSTSKAIALTSFFRPSASAHRSDLFNKMTGTAPLSQATDKYLSMRRRLKFKSSPVTIKRLSRLAATTCSSVTCPATLRLNAFFLGISPCIVALFSFDRTETATQSPKGHKFLVEI